mgnify:CR=1 FL=1
MENMNLDYSIFIENIQTLINDNYENMITKDISQFAFDYEEYHSYDRYQSWVWVQNILKHIFEI